MNSVHKTQNSIGEVSERKFGNGIQGYQWKLSGELETMIANGTIISPIFLTNFKKCYMQLRLVLMADQAVCNVKCLKTIEGTIMIYFSGLRSNVSGGESHEFKFEKSSKFSNCVQVFSDGYKLSKIFSFALTKLNLQMIDDDDLETEAEIGSGVLCDYPWLQRKFDTYNDFKLLLNNEDFSDFVIEAEEKKLYAHKCILALKSPVFAKMLNNKMIEKEKNYVTVDDVKHETLQEMLRFMYTGEVKNFDKIASDLFYAADKYQVELLKDMCIERLIENMNAENVIGYIHLSERHGINKLKNKAIEFIIDNAKDVVDKSEFKELATQNPTFFDIFKAMALAYKGKNDKAMSSKNSHGRCSSEMYEKAAYYCDE